MIKKLLLVGLAAGGIYTYDQYDKKMNYKPVNARITAVADTCYMEKREGKKTWTSDVLPCAVADFAVKEHPKWQGYDVRHAIEVKFAFTSPVDGKVHDGKRKFDSMPKDKPYTVGDTLLIRASTTEGDKTREM